MKRVGVPLLTLLLVTPALAVDGVIEINQARALAGGINVNDVPGFPVILNEPGSYRLTGDLSAPPGVDGVRIETDNVTLDLNGFSLSGGGGPIADGILIGGSKNVEIRNGTVRGFSRAGIFASLGGAYARVVEVRVFSNFQGIELQGQGSLVDHCTATGNGTGIRVYDGGLITGSVARANTSYGLLLAATAGYGGNVVTGNNGGDANEQVAGGGLQTAPNVCGTDLICP